MVTVEGTSSCEDLAEKQSEMLSMVRSLTSRKRHRQRLAAPTTESCTGDSVGDFFKAVRKALGEFHTMHDILMRSGERMTERWLTPDAMRAKKRKSKFWTDLLEELYQGQMEKLKEVLRDRDRSLVVRGTLEKSTTSPIVGVLVATKKTEVDMKVVEEEGIPAWRNSVKNPSIIPSVSEEELHNATDDEYRYKLQCWGTDWGRLSTMCLAHDTALVKHTRGIKEFWLIDALGVMERERGRGIGRRMLEEVEERARAENLPIILWADRDAVSFYIKCGFRVLETHTYRGSEEERPDAIMKWV
ncbi:hypothetical protein F5B18DRAFT_613933 [Nemania serpens]|nr:hypothetical protein F5B18DRAFT_613933 [Nemania serpens]